MRSNWKIKNYIYNSSRVINGVLHLYQRKGFVNPFFEGQRLNIYVGGRFRNYKVRPEMVTQPLNSFISTRPSFSSIRKKFVSLKKKR